MNSRARAYIIVDCPRPRKEIEMAGTRKRTAGILVFVSPEQRKRITEAAKAVGLSLSAFFRLSALKETLHLEIVGGMAEARRLKGQARMAPSDRGTEARALIKQVRSHAPGQPRIPEGMFVPDQAGAEVSEGGGTLDDDVCPQAIEGQGREVSDIQNPGGGVSDIQNPCPRVSDIRNSVAEAPVPDDPDPDDPIPLARPRAGTARARRGWPD